MSERVPAGLPASVEITVDQAGLNVGFTLFDDSGSTPVQVTGQVGQVNGVYPALNYAGTSYRAQIPGQPGKWYVMHIAIYTDETFTTVDGTEPQGSKSLYFDPPASGSGGGGSGGGLKCVVSSPVIKCIVKQDQIRFGGSC